MNNNNKYRFSDFTLLNYQRIISLVKEEGFCFITFDSDLFNCEKFVLWRHDVEFSPDIALRMAEIENKKEIKATYFFQLHSEFYNILEKHHSEIVHKIQEYGHDIGLHFDSHFFGIESESLLDKFLTLDKAYFEKIFNLKLKVFSFHNTNEFVLNCRKETYAGLINVYSNHFQKELSYCTDSTGFWRYEILEDIIKDPKTKKLQVLTHDAMWQDEVMSPRQRIFKTINERSEYLKKFYDDGLKLLNAKNVDWDVVL